MSHIPKIIHYCWFGRKPLPEMAIKCISSWKKHFPDYEIKEWNEDNFDINIVPYTTEAYSANKYAFVSDYARLYILYKYGGLYFDTDVEVIRNMDHIVHEGPFMGYEHDPIVADNKFGEVALGLGLGVPSEYPLIKQILDYYNTIHFINPDGSFSNDTIVTITTNLLKKQGLKVLDGIQVIQGIHIYPKEFFCPKDYITGKLHITDNTISIHHYGASWYPWYAKVEMYLSHILGISYRDFLHRNVPKVNNFFKNKFNRK